jgi:hypothetical protein
MYEKYDKQIDSSALNIRKSLAFAVRERLANDMEAAKVRDSIQKIYPMPPGWLRR